VGDKGVKFAHLDFPHLTRMAQAMVADETFDPIAIRLLGAQAIVLQAHYVAHLIEEFFSLATALVWLYNGMHGFGFYRSPPLEASPD
jgi:hypothetical protein